VKRLSEEVRGGVKKVEKGDLGGRGGELGGGRVFRGARVRRE